MQGIVDTATDIVAVEGADCTVCNGEVYDISGNLDNGKATISPLYVGTTYGEALLEGKLATD